MLSPGLQNLLQACVNAKLDILRFALPRLLVSPEGQLVETQYDPETGSRLAEIDVIWAQAMEAEMRQAHDADKRANDYNEILGGRKASSQRCYDSRAVR